jgi:small GTP-binding protein
VTCLPLEITQLTRLTKLSLSGNQLTSLPLEITQHTSLTELDLSNNQLTSLPSEITQLTNLTQLDLLGNGLCKIPKEMAELHNVKYISLRFNPLEIAIPAKWVGGINGSEYAQEILSHYKRMYEEGGRELDEARVLVVGEGEVGKTSLVTRLIDNTYDPNQKTTLIVEKRPLPLGDVRTQVWDFGGQEHMHATHQFFFSGRSLYLLVFDTRGSLEQNKVEYWLTLINAYSQNAPVILVGNKCDQHEMDVEKRRLREKYPNIRGFVGTSASTGEHIDELRQKIQEEVRTMPQVRVLFSADYLAVKDEMETLRAAHISHEEFVRVCERHGVSDAKDQDTLLDLLHDLGTVLYFRDADGNPLLPALGVLNPNWVTRGVYLIVTNPALKDKFKGRLTMSLLREILSAPEYSRHIEDIAKLLERFELCYRADDSSYWLPSLMEKDEPAALGDFTSGLTSAMKFEYWYPELPKSVIVRFIVKAHKMILDNKVWRYGAVLKLDENTALVRADERDKRVSIFIAGEESTRRDALAILRAQFDDIHAMFATPPEAFIYSPQYPDLRLPFADMKTLAKSEREHKAVYQGKPVTINLHELLDGFVTPQERRKDKEREEKEFGRKGDIHINIKNMHGSSLTIGDDNTSSVSVTNSFNTLPPDLQAALLELIKKVDEVLQVAEESEDKDELNDELESLRAEANKSRPKKERIKITVEGLKKAAENIKDVGAPVLTVAAKVIALLNSLP